ncbi:hypothetical protein CDQ92_13065 [Sphingopyxis bauzanensis]|uniref:Uncharacterized protein n=1 Tax=Sphingopyxis bauzanensis TaxID=651663 RepID=A0A246JRS0_9SPHN|nr:hypothetical protein CDQ92_13065 [Sphingopyxis bauzanensis]
MGQFSVLILRHFLAVRINRISIASIIGAVPSHDRRDAGSADLQDRCFRARIAVDEFKLDQLGRHG